jgi:hypothetical protein
MILRKLTSLFDFAVDQKSLGVVEGAIQGIKKHLSIAAVAAGAAGLGGALLAMAKQTANAGDAAVKGAAQVGLTAEAYQELGYAADLSGVSVEEMGAGIARLARKGGFRDTETALASLADRFASMPDGLEKTALAQEYFGRSGMKLIPMLNSGAAGLAQLRQEAQDLGIVLSTETGKKSEEFNDNLSRLQYAAKGLSFTIGSALLPEISKIAEELVGWVKQNNKLIRQKAAEWVKKIVTGVKDFVKWTRDLYDRINPVIQKLGGWESVLRKVLVALIAIKAVQLTMSLIEMAKAARMAAISLGAMSASSASMALIAAAILLLGLGIEDLKVYAEGGDSAVGRFLDRFQGADGIIGGAAIALKEFLDALGILQDRHKEQDVVVRFVADSTESWWDEFFLSLTDRLWDLKTLLIAVFLAPLMPSYLAYQAIMAAFGEDIEKLWGKVKKFWDDLTTEVSLVIEKMITGITDFISQAFDKVLGGIRDVVATAKDIPGIGRLAGYLSDKVLPPAPTPAATAAGRAPGNVTVSSGPVTVHAQTGASPEEIGRAVSEAQQEALLPLLQSTYLNVQSAEE